MGGRGHPSTSTRRSARIAHSSSPTDTTSDSKPAKSSSSSASSDTKKRAPAKAAKHADADPAHNNAGSHAHKKPKTEPEVNSPSPNVNSSPAKGKGKRASVSGHSGGVLIERGRVEYLARPKLASEAVEGVDDAKALYIALFPAGESASCKVIRVSKKTLPEQKKAHGEGTGRAQTFWAFVDAAGDEQMVRESLKEYKYDTKTYGERTVKEAELYAWH